MVKIIDTIQIEELRSVVNDLVMAMINDDYTLDTIVSHLQDSLGWTEANRLVSSIKRNNT